MSIGIPPRETYVITVALHEVVLSEYWEVFGALPQRGERVVLQWFGGRLAAYLAENGAPMSIGFLLPSPDYGAGSKGQVAETRNGRDPSITIVIEMSHGDSGRV